MAEYINLDTPLELYRLRGNYYERFSITLRELFDFNKIPYTAADVRPVVLGKWIPDYDYTEYDYDGSTPLAEPRKFQDGWQCSLCGGYMPSETNYCPNCGSDMREES